ncbi:hypothetical protein HNR62_000335 [Oceanisphaera litoralis]|uniref:hypothetical protein n=1 Tax=Oceanisphaera litoralis TaxID=225144 RepID=UPI001958C331|nr:hypothetical protein [Oceanisphaera litoralis]MBM7454506.1 hypothetical protein [Oceanisphaera litoralis]
MTTVQKIQNLMHHSSSGSLMQAFLLVALEQYAVTVQEAKGHMPGLTDSFINEAAWNRCADEVMTILGSREHP